jgi:hypothetical protein
VALAAFAVSSAGAQDTLRRSTPTRGSARSIIGVFDAQSGKPIEGVEIRDQLSGDFVKTTKTGTAPLNFLTQAGPFYMFEVRMVGYRPKSYKIRADSLKELLTEVLDPALPGTDNVHSLPVVNVDAKFNLATDDGRRENFEARCASGHTACVRQEDIMKHRSAKLLDFLVGKNGITAPCNVPGTNGFKMQGKADESLPSCMPTVGCWYLNGFVFRPISNQPYMTYSEIIKAAPVSDIEGIEIYYREENPLKFGGPICNSVVIWTK